MLTFAENNKDSVMYRSIANILKASFFGIYKVGCSYWFDKELQLPFVIIETMFGKYILHHILLYFVFAIMKIKKLPSFHSF